MSNGRGMRAKVSQADTAPRSGEGAAFLSPRKRAAAALSCSNISRTSRSLLSASVGCDPALVGERHADTVPINRLGAQLFE